MSSRSESVGGPAATADRILDAALTLGERVGWDAVHLHDVAHASGIRLADVGHHFPSKDALAERWFDRADVALRAAPQSPGWHACSPRERLHRAVFCWLDALAAHRGLTASMLRYKLQPDHLHLQALGLIRISRTVQWIREVAGLPSVGWRREMEEAVLTAIYVATFTCWLTDDSPGGARTHTFLDRQLALAEAGALRLGARSVGAPPAEPQGLHPLL